MIIQLEIGGAQSKMSPYLDPNSMLFNLKKKKTYVKKGVPS